MKTIARLLILFLFSSGLLGAAAVPAEAQQASTDLDETCPAVVYRALDQLSESCTSIGRNQVCYGHNDVHATFRDLSATPNFAAPADTVEVTALESMVTAPLDTKRGKWGLALMNVQANVPESLPGQGVVFLLMGNTTVMDRVGQPQTVDESVQLPLETNHSANLRMFPTNSATIVGSVPNRAVVVATGLSHDGQWLRVQHDGSYAWMTRMVIDPNTDLSTLPAFDPAYYSTMQAFYFTSGLGAPACEQALDAVLIQGPNNVMVDIQANGAYIRIGSTILLRLVTPDTMQLITVSGTAYVDGLAVPAGSSALAPYDPVAGVVTGPFYGLHSITCATDAHIRIVESLPVALLHYAPTLPACVVNAPAPPPAANAPYFGYVPGAPTTNTAAPVIAPAGGVPSVQPGIPSNPPGNGGGNPRSGCPGCNGNGNCNGHGNCGGNGNGRDDDDDD
jgi:hypothetical protein